MLKRKTSATGNTTQNRKKRTVIQSDDGTGTDSGDGEQDAMQPTNHDGDDEIVDTTEAENTQRAEANLLFNRKRLCKTKSIYICLFQC